MLLTHCDTLMREDAEATPEGVTPLLTLLDAVRALDADAEATADLLPVRVVDGVDELLTVPLPLVVGDADTVALRVLLADVVELGVRLRDCVGDGVGVCVGVGGMHALSVAEPAAPDPPLTPLCPTNVAAVNVTNAVFAYDEPPPPPP